MSLFGVPFPPVQVTPADFVGRWSFCDDGWPGSLTLQHTGGEDLSGIYFSERFDDDFRVTGRVADGNPHAVELIVHEFNWLPEQRYSGYLLTRSRNAIAGRTQWKDQPFGFFATRAARQPLGLYRPGIAQGDDFAGSWTAYLDGETATVVLAADADAAVLRGSCTVGADGYDVIGTHGAEVPYDIALTMRTRSGGDIVAELSGHLMSRPKNAISGVMTAGDAHRGFIMIRYA
jgi:hypothetical protein